MKQLKIEVGPILNTDGEVSEVHVHATQNGVTAVVGRATRWPTPVEPVESVYARAMREAADWLMAGPVDLEQASKRHAARTPMPDDKDE